MAAPGPTPAQLTPAQAWARLAEGNARFVADAPQHPDQDASRRELLTSAQYPFAVVFGCSDSRLAAEIVFDQGLGDMFVVRTAGHVVDTTVIGSIEYGVDVLHTPLVVVLGHDNCGAINAAVDALVSGTMPDGYVRAIVDRVIPSIMTRRSMESTLVYGLARSPSRATLLREHVTNTVATLTGYSHALATAVDEGRLAVVGVEYTLAQGRARLVAVHGDVGAAPDMGAAPKA